MYQNKKVLVRKNLPGSTKGNKYLSSVKQLIHFTNHRHSKRVATSVTEQFGQDDRYRAL